MLHWATNKLGFEVTVESSELSKLPSSSYFELPPYTQITHQVNPGEYPIPQQIDEFFRYQYSNMVWMKTSNENIYKFNLQGFIVLTAPATEYIGDSFVNKADVVDDTYDSVFFPPSITWSKTENHTTKETEYYKAPNTDIQVRLAMSILPETDVSNEQRLNIKEN